MTKTTATVVYNTTRNSRSRDAYTVKFDASMPEDEVTNRLVQVGPVYNNRVHYVGVFSSQHAAEEAAREYVSA